MKQQHDPLLKPKRSDEPSQQPRPLMNSIVNPDGIIPEPISEVVKKEEALQEEPKPAPVAAKQPAVPHEDALKEQAERNPTDPNKEVFGSRKQMQNDLQYTSVMKKQKEIKKEAAEKKVTTVSDRSDNVLMKLKTVFPYDFFPNTISIDANKVSIIDKRFFASESVTSILLEEITDVVVNTNAFLAQMVITYSHHPLQPLKYKITHLRKNEALKATNIIQGLLVLRISEGIDLSKLKPEEIIKELSNIGNPHVPLSAS